MIPGSRTIETQVLNKITPSVTEKKHMQTTIESLKKQVQKEIEKTKLPIIITLVGSIAKDTYIRNAVDIDLFLMFPPSTPRETLQKNGLAIGRALLKNQEECFAEHPYVRGTFHGVKTEIVPCYKIESASQKLSAVDRTPLHTNYIAEHLKTTQKKDVRLFKQFLKGIGCYGAEAEVEGFSGYLCEIMILKFGTFQQLIKEATHWKEGSAFTLTSREIPSFSTPLIFIDPVDPERNVASAVSKNTFHLFITACKAYVEKPRLTFFFPNTVRPWTSQKIQKEIGTHEYLGILIKKPDIIPENLYPQIRKAVRSITELCEQYDFTILDATFFIQDKEIYIILNPKTTKISPTVLHEGPPVTLKKNTHEFKNKWTRNLRTVRQPFEQEKRLFVEIKREYTSLQDLLSDKLHSISLGKHIDPLLSKKVILLNTGALQNKKLTLFWTQYLEKRMPWEY